MPQGTRRKTQRGGKRGGEGKSRAEKLKETSLPQKHPRQSAAVVVPGPVLARWTPISQHAHDYIAASLDTALISSLPQNSSNEEYSLQLRRLKKRLIERCSTICGPPKKRSGLTSCKLLSLEEKHLKEGENSLQTLQEELDRTLDCLERNQEEMDELQAEIQQMTESLEGEEEEALPSPSLNLPVLPPDSLERHTLQLTSLENLPNVSDDLRSLSRSEELQDLLTFLDRSHALVNPRR